MLTEEKLAILQKTGSGEVQELVAEVMRLREDVAKMRASVDRKLGFARECMDDVEAAMERWRARDGQMRPGDPPAARKREARG